MNKIISFFAKRDYGELFFLSAIFSLVYYTILKIFFIDLSTQEFVLLNIFSSILSGFYLLLKKMENKGVNFLGG